MAGTCQSRNHHHHLNQQLWRHILHVLIIPNYHVKCSMTEISFFRVTAAQKLSVVTATKWLTDRRHLSPRIEAVWRKLQHHRNQKLVTSSRLRVSADVSVASHQCCWWLGWTIPHYMKISGQSNLTKSASRGAHSPVRGHPRGSKVVPLNSWGRVSY